ncbi:MAG: nucleotidyltransferase family protein [Oligoflexia bacterium]|nr:nucleotidyltransferase family protein [Oligoflexia bacterium]
MILAAGFGTRLGAIGKTTPKCLVEAGGKAMLEHVAQRLKLAGVTELVINLHHLGDQVKSFVERRGNFGVQVTFSHEATILGTGGGIKAARKFLADAPYFLVHNGDVYSEFDLAALAQTHVATRALATLAVMTRETSRPLLFTPEGRLAGWQGGTGSSEIIGDESTLIKRAFSGIHILSREIFEYMDQQSGEFSIISTYMRAVKAGAQIAACETGNSFWIDIGTPEKLQELRRRLG